MFKTATDRRDPSSERCGARNEPAGSSASPPRHDGEIQTKRNPDAVRPSRRERRAIEEDPERWDGLS
jgi:hypothetical protein